jgi:hypothetical protein
MEFLTTKAQRHKEWQGEESTDFADSTDFNSLNLLFGEIFGLPVFCLSFVSLVFFVVQSLGLT